MHKPVKTRACLGHTPYMHATLAERFQTALAGFKSFVCLRPDECSLQWHWFWLAVSPGLKMPSESKRNPHVECVP